MQELWQNCHLEETLYFKDVKKRDQNSHQLASFLKTYLTKKADVRQLVVASSSGKSARIFAKEFKDTSQVKLVIVKLTAQEELVHGAFDQTIYQELQAQNIPVICGTNSLTHNVGWALSEHTRNFAPAAIVAQAFYRFCPGLKTAIEVGIMATDAGLVAHGSQAVAVAGTNGGADTAVQLKCAEAMHFRKLAVEKILAKPLLNTKAG
jgi:hypothetical protein